MGSWWHINVRLQLNLGWWSRRSHGSRGRRCRMFALHMPMLLCSRAAMWLRLRCRAFLRRRRLACPSQQEAGRRRQLAARAAGCPARAAASWGWLPWRPGLLMRCSWRSTHRCCCCHAVQLDGLAGKWVAAGIQPCRAWHALGWPAARQLLSWRPLRSLLPPLLIPGRRALVLLRLRGWRRLGGGVLLLRDGDLRRLLLQPAKLGCQGSSTC